nr:DUF3857 and transglutaminase domain-containing protein [Bacteroidota bacterium]
MDKRILLLILLLWLIKPIGAQDFMHAAVFIPDTLKQNADAVIRFHNTEITRLSAGKAKVTVQYAVTVLNKNGQSDAWLAVYYDGHRKVKHIKGRYYNAMGFKIDKVENDDIKDYSSYPDFTFFSDSRVKSIKPVMNQYPYTAEYEYELQLDGLVGFDVWMPVRAQGISLEKAGLVFKSDADLPVRYKAENAEFDFQETDDGGKITYQWKIQHIPAYEQEPFMPPLLSILPYVMLAPVAFKYDETRGNFENWENYGQWVNELLQDRDNLSKEAQEKILNLVGDDDDIEERIRKIYGYVQQNTRYVNISLGIGGFQPLKAMDVDNTGYGDCKALTNYTKALLKLAGIESFYSEIGNGKERAELFPDFSSINQTNHVILCVPAGDDTLWLECTNQNIPCGYVGAGNANRRAVLVTGGGGRLVNTPRYNEPDNLTLTTVQADINEKGNLNCSVIFDYKGLACDKIYYLMNSSAREQKEWLLSYLLPDQVIIEDYAFLDTFADIYSNRLNLKITAENYTTVIGRRMMVEPNIFNQYISGITKRPDRRFDLFVQQGYTEIDTAVIGMPELYRIEYLPENVSVVCSLGNYSISYDTAGENLHVARSLVIKQGTYPKESYDEVHAFFNTIAENDTRKVVLIRKE